MYYIGFLKNDVRHAVLFKSLKTPKRGDFTYFVSVSGPYNSWRHAKYTLDVLKESYGVKENPVKNKITSKDVTKYTGLTKKVISMYNALRRKNPERIEHEGKFLRHISQLEKYVVGSKEYIDVLAKAYKEIKLIQGKYENKT